MIYDNNGVAQGFSGGVQTARKNGIYDKIIKFVGELEKLGYKKNVGEEGNKKVVLTFGFKDHENHIHVSNVTNRKPPTKTSTSTQNTTQQSYTHCKGPEFNLYCKNEKIKQLQACLGMDLKYQTGNFGPITSRNLTNIGYKDNKITSDQIDRICKRTNNTSTITPATQYGTTTAPSIQGGISGGQQGVGDVEVDPNGY
jgi:hypothetical protein